MRIGVPASSSVSWTPLALTLGLHLLLVMAWLLRPGAQVAPADEHATQLVMVAPVARPVLPSPPVSPHVLPQPVRQTAPRRMAQVAPPPQAAPSDALPAAPDERTDSEAVHTDAAPAAAVAAAAAPGDLLARSRALAARIARELPKGDNPLTAEPETRWAHFNDTVAGARRTGSMAGSVDSHTAADGVIVYRKTVGSRVRCYRSGGVGGLNPSDGQTAGSVPCPTGVRWTRL